MYACMHTCMHLVCLRTHAWVHACICMHACFACIACLACVYAYVCVLACMHVSACMCVCMCACMLVYTYVHVIVAHVVLSRPVHSNQGWLLSWVVSQWLCCHLFDQRLCQVLATMSLSKSSTPSGELKKSINKKNSEQMAIITSSCNLDFELQTIVISTIENHKRCKDMSNALSVLELIAKDKQDKKRGQQRI